MKIIKWLIYRFFLYPLILRNYKLRKQSAINGDNKHPDELYWADNLGIDWGFLPYSWLTLFKRIRFVLFDIPHHQNHPLFRGGFVNFDGTKIKRRSTDILRRFKIDNEVKKEIKSRLK